MKKLLCAMLCIVMLASLFLVGCSNDSTSSDSDTKAETLKFGMGVYSYIETVKNADADANGSAKAVSTVAAVLLDKDGKIIDCKIDSIDSNLGFTSKGEALEIAELATKNELGDNYGMVAYGGASKEWYEQADAFAGVAKGKTIDQVRALVAGENKGTEDVINAGCTITVSDFVLAIANAVENATDYTASKDNKISLGTVAIQSAKKNADEEPAGSNATETTFAAMLLDGDNKVVAAKLDCVEAKISFDAKGVTEAVAGTILTSKYNSGSAYGMSAYGQDLNGDGTIKEWFEQADAFTAACIGKTANEISAFAINTGYGSDDIQNAGCTINIAEIVKAAVKAATVA